MRKSGVLGVSKGCYEDSSDFQTMSRWSGSALTCLQLQHVVCVLCSWNLDKDTTHGQAHQ